jgi:hypothetical protein
VIANQAGNVDYAAAPPVTETVNATKASQAITVTTPAPPSAAFGQSFTVAATGGGSGNAVTYTVGAGSSSVCTVSGATYTMISKVGTCNVDINQAGTSNYAAAAQVVEAVTAAPAVRIPPTVTFTGAPATEANGSNFTVTATSDEIGSYAVVPTIMTPGTVCTVGTVTSNGSGGYQATVTMVKATGTCTLNAKWAGSNGYAAASATQSTTATH